MAASRAMNWLRALLSDLERDYYFVHQVVDKWWSSGWQLRESEEHARRLIEREEEDPR